MPLARNAGRTGTSQRPNSKRRGSKAARNSSIRTARRTSKLSMNRISRSPPLGCAASHCHYFDLPYRVTFPVHDHRNVAATLEKLHHAFPGARELRPSRIRFGVLLKPAEFPALKLKVHLAQPPAGRTPHGKLLPAHLDCICLIHQGLSPDRYERFLKCHVGLEF